jgi:hypothetical protein
MILTVVRSTKWTPETIGKLNLDDIDYTGLIYWYDDICKEIEDMKTPKK